MPSTRSTTSNAPSSSGTCAECADCQAEVASLREAAALLAETAAPPRRRRCATGCSPTSRRSGRCHRWSPERDQPGRGASPPVSRPGRRRRGGGRDRRRASPSCSRGTTTARRSSARPSRCCRPPTPSRWTKEFPDGARRPSSGPGRSTRRCWSPRTCRPPPDGQGLRSSGSSTTTRWCPAGIMPAGPDNEVLLTGDAATADGAGITVEPEGGSPRAQRTESSPSSSSRATDEPTTDPDRGRRLRSRRPHRGVRRLAHRARDPLRGRRPARRPRGHPPWSRTRRPRARHRHRLHRAQPAHLPGAAAAVRRARRGDPALGDVDVDPRRRQRPRVGRRARPAGPLPDGRQPAATRATCGCSPRSRGSTGGRQAAARPSGDRASRCGSSSTTVGSRRTSCATSWSRSSPPCGRATRTVALDYPARYLFTFLEHHGMLGVFGSPQWRTVTGGSQRVRRGAWPPSWPRSAPAPRSPRCSRPPTGVEITDGNGEVTTYDAVVIATHPAQALAMLAEPTPVQRDGPRRDCPTRPTPRCCTPTRRCCPRARNAWASWNFSPALRPRAASSPTT